MAMLRLQLAMSLSLLATLAAVNTAFAIRSYPVWDDGFMELSALDMGAASVAESMQDRPLAGRIWQWMLEDRDAVLLRSGVFNWILGFGTALFTWYLARQLFPARPALALATACVGATPFFVYTQLVMITHPGGPGICSVIAFGAIYLVVETIRFDLPAWNVAARWFAGAVLLVVSGLITEYFVAATLAAIVWILSLAWGKEPSVKKRAFASGIALFVLTTATYFVYHVLSHADVHTQNRPEHVLAQDFAWRGKVTLPVWISTVYKGCLGSFLQRWGRFGFRA